MASVSSHILTIANGQQTSDAVPSGSATAFGLQLPATFTGTAITFTVSGDKGTTYQTLYDVTNTAVSMTVAQGRSYDLPAELATWTHFKIVSGSAEGGARTLYVVAKRP